MSSYLPVGGACYGSKSRGVGKYFCSSLSQCQRHFREPHVIADSQTNLEGKPAYLVSPRPVTTPLPDSLGLLLLYYMPVSLFPSLSSYYMPVPPCLLVC